MEKVLTEEERHEIVMKNIAEAKEACLRMIKMLDEMEERNKNEK